FYAEQLLKAEAIWTKSIRNPKSDIDFNASNGWFDYPEKELNEIYTSEERKEENNFYSRLEENSLWRISNLLSSKWYVKRYAFLSLFRLIYKSAWVIFSYYILILGIIILTGIKLINQENFSSFESIILYITFVTVILGFIFIRQGDAQKRFHGLHLFMPRLLVAVIAGWVTIFLGTDMLGFNPSKMVGSPNILLSSTEGILNLELKGNEPQPTIYQNIIHNGDCRFFSLIA